MTSEVLIKYPPPIYFGKTIAYELYIYCGNTDYASKLLELIELCSNTINLMHTIHAVLTFHQSAKCLCMDV